MGEYWWLLAGAAVWIPALIAVAAQRPEAGGCPQCGHETVGQTCGQVDDYSGWVSDLCECSNDYHSGSALRR